MSANGVIPPPEERQTVAELQVSPARLREALSEAEAYLAKLRDVIAARYALIDDEERMAVRVEQRIASLRWRLDLLPDAEQGGVTP